MAKVFFHKEVLCIPARDIRVDHKESRAFSEAIEAIALKHGFSAEKLEFWNCCDLPILNWKQLKKEGKAVVIRDM